MNSKPKGRFIAGAVCPRCAAMDRIIVYQQEGVETRECIECGFVDSIKPEQDAIEISSADMETRVNKKPKAKDQSSSTLTFYPTPKKKH